MIRADVYLKNVRAATPEWTHEHSLTFDDAGVWLAWDDADARTFIPYTNIHRIDFSECACPNCQPSKGPA